MHLFKKYSLLGIVFLIGGCVLIIEIVAIRILSPYYGNTIFTVSSVISTVLVALSLGYYLGGRLADKYASERNFYTIILLSGLSIFSIYFLKLSLLPVMGYSLSMVSGPIVSSLALFFLPNILLGTLSPFAIKIQTLRFPNKGVGYAAGEIFFWSTTGSVSGSLLTGFVLIPLLETNKIILMVAAVIIVLGLFPLVKSRTNDKIVFSSIILIILGILLNHTVLSKDSNILYNQAGIYEQILIYDREYDGKPARFLQQDLAHSGAIFLKSDELVYDYSNYIFLCEILKPDIRNIFIIGGGAYSLPMALLKIFPNANIDVAEIEPSLFLLAKKYFKVIETERLNNFITDGRRFLYETDKKYDLIFGDAYYGLSFPHHLVTAEFFNLVKEKLNKDGIFMTNFMGDLSEEKPSFIISAIKTFKTVFPNSYFFAVQSPDRIGSQNIIFIGLTNEKKINFTDHKIINHKNKFMRSLKTSEIDINKFDFSQHSIFTDDFSPVEYLMAKTIKNKQRQ